MLGAHANQEPKRQEDHETVPRTFLTLFSWLMSPSVAFKDPSARHCPRPFGSVVCRLVV